MTDAVGHAFALLEPYLRDTDCEFFSERGGAHSRHQGLAGGDFRIPYRAALRVSGVRK